MELLKKLYHKYSDTKPVQIAGKIYRNGFFASNYLAYRRLKKLAERKNDLSRPVRVVYLCQYTQAWNKMKSIFEMMLSDDRFNASILAVPDDIRNTNDKIYMYFKELYGENNVINGYENSSWYKLEDIKPDYVFYQRPYDQYLPKEYQSRAVSEYAKICHLVYGYLLTETTKDICTNKRFFRNVYMYFAENTICRDFNINRFKLSHKKGYRKTPAIGYPVLEYFMKQKEKYNKKDNDSYKVLWTPRWSEDKEAGGSNFINFKDKIVEFANKNPEFYMVFRPHPMTFNHFISVGRITEEEVKDYLRRYNTNDRLEYNNTAEYVDVFWNTDALLTDVSSIIVEYFITGKPMIYCDTGAVPDTFFKEILKVMYVVDTWEQAEGKLLELKSGKDPLKEARHKKIAELMGQDFEHISERFLDEIYKDYIS